MAYNITPFQLLPSQQDQRPSVGYENGVGNPNDYEYYVDPQTRTVKRRAKQGLASYAGTAAPASGDSGGGFTPMGASGGGFGSGPGAGPSLGGINAALGAMSLGGKMSQAPGLIGLLGSAIGGLGSYGAGRAADQIGQGFNTLGLLNDPAVQAMGIQSVSDVNGNPYGLSNSQSIQDANVAAFGPSGFDTSLGGYTGMSNDNSNEGTSGSPGYGGGGFL